MLLIVSKMIVGKTIIQIERQTREKLKSYGKKGDTYNDIIWKLIKSYEEIKEKKK